MLNVKVQISTTELTIASLTDPLKRRTELSEQLNELVAEQ